MHDTKTIGADTGTTHNRLGKALFFQPKLTVNQPDDIYEREADHMAGKVMQMGISQNSNPAFFKASAAPVQRKCAACEEEGKHVHRKKSGTGEQQGGNELDNYVGSLSTSGQPMPETSRQFFEPKFGRDFSQVRLHTDTVAAKSAQSINALAFTTGNNIVFNSGQYSPDSDGGKKLMAHELTHVVQQANGLTAVQRITCPEGVTAPPAAAAGTRNTVDARAQNIITRAADAGLDIGTRATRSISDIICAYYPADAGKVRNITYNSSLPGLATAPVGSGAAAQGDVSVGNNFISNINTTTIARRVLQTGHELDHIGQYRTGLAGHTHQDEREFLSFYHNGVVDEFEGTGRMPDSMRKSIIDQALGYYYCLDAALQQQHQTKLQELLTRRQTVNGTRGNQPTPAPTACLRQP